LLSITVVGLLSAGFDEE